jgi:hypothetical protein
LTSASLTPEMAGCPAKPPRVTTWSWYFDL